MFIDEMSLEIKFVFCTVVASRTFVKEGVGVMLNIDVFSYVGSVRTEVSAFLTFKPDNTTGVDFDVERLFQFYKRK